MIEVLEFTFQSFWHFVGVAFLLWCLSPKMNVSVREKKS